jgi:septal ring factor EnvC (AmiA/AmiB activator)
MFWSNARLERRIEVLTRYIVRWRKNDMANWSDLAAKIIELKRETERVFATLDDVRKRLDDVLKADAVDQAEVQKAHDDIAAVVAEMDQKIHADGM